LIYYFFLALALVTASLGQVMYKSYSKKNSYSQLFGCIFCFCLTPVASYLALKGIGLDVVYMATSLNSFIIIVLSKLFLEENINRHQLIGAVFIFLGVVVYGA
jgi:drug/metabolite transporter (DMT)-like permease